MKDSCFGGKKPDKKESICTCHCSCQCGSHNTYCHYSTDGYCDSMSTYTQPANLVFSFTSLGNSCNGEET
ncbi:MAG: hypothetical protein JXA60_02990 [Candidatus Coatesbacteria bacterium]|nr:hypothetical protein [Candidatus Coatesbacteria bacterium]